MVTRPFPLFSYATTVGIHSSLLLFTAFFLPRTSLVIFTKTSNFPFLQPASSLDRPQLEFLEALTASPPLTLAWLCAGVFLISFSWGGRIRRQAYEQQKPVDKTDFEAKEKHMEWQKQGAIVRLQLLSYLFAVSKVPAELAQFAHLHSPSYRHLPRTHRALWRPNREVSHNLSSICTIHLLKLVATTSKPVFSHFFYPFLRTSPPPMSLGRPPSQCSRTDTLMLY